MAKKPSVKSVESKVKIVSKGNDRVDAQPEDAEDQIESMQSEAQIAPQSSEQVPPLTNLPNFGDRYEVLETIAEGGMGSVYKAKDKSTGQVLAIKTLQIDLANDAVALKRFEREADAAIKLNHPNLVAVFEHGTTPGGAPFIVMDFIEGESLSDVLKKEGALEPERAINLFIQIAEGLSYAHENGVIHRDVKPTNIILSKTENGEVVRLVDFGIAMVVPTAGRETRDLTQTGEVFGSPHYMSPEQCLGFMLDNRSDIYSFGCLMYETLTGDPPFGGSNPIQLVVKHINEDPKKFSRELKTGKLIDKLESITFRCLEKEQDLRFQSVTDLISDLRLVKDGKPIPRYSKGVRARPWLTKKQALGALALACMAVCYLPYIPMAFLPDGWSIHVMYGMYAMVCAGGIYSTLTAGIERLKNMRQPKATERQWLITFILLGIGIAGCGLMPEILKYVFYGYQSAPKWFDSIVIWTDVFFSTSAFFAITSLLVALFCRSSDKVHYGKVLPKVLVSAAVILAGITIACPDKMATVCTRWGWVASRSYPDLSINMYRLAYSLDKKNHSAVEQMARHLQKQKNYDEAIDVLTQYIQNNPDVISDVYSTRAHIYIEAGKLDQAEDDFNHIIQTDRDASTEAYRMRGLVRGMKGNLAGAQEDFNHSLAIDPSLNNAAYGSKTAMYCAFGKYDEALKDLNQRRSMNVSETHWYATRALIYEKLGRIDDAKADYRMVIKTYEDEVKKDEKERQTWKWRDGDIFLSAFANKKLGNEAEFEKLIAKLHDPDDWKDEDGLSLTLNLKYSKLDFSWKPIDSR